MPLIGFGSAAGAYPKPSDEEMVSIFIEAIEVGYRHFDTAALYHTEETLGRAVAQAIESGLIKTRDEVFITSKLWCNNAHGDLVLSALENTLMKLGLDYVDLYLIHWPARLKPEAEGHIFAKEDILSFDIQKTWEAMEECTKLGLAKSIGVSNFSCHKLSTLLQHATIPPAVNQVEMNLAWQQKKMLVFCKENGIYVSAWSPLGGNGVAVMGNSILKDNANARGKSLAQVALRWIHEQGASVIVKSFNKKRMRQNLEIFDWELNKDDLALIQKIPQRRGFSGEWFVSPNGPYKSFEELWDGEFKA